MRPVIESGRQHDPSEPPAGTGPVRMDTPNVFALSRALQGDAERFGTDAAAILRRLAGDGHSVGVDPRNVPGGQARRRYEETREQAERLVGQVGALLTSMSRSTRALVVAFGDQDALNGASTAEVRAALGLSDPSREG